MRKIGLDVGDKTIGVAVSDALNITAQGITTIERVGIRKDAGKVMDYIKEYDCDTVVIGLPRSMDGRDSQQTEKVYEFKTMLENKMKSSGMRNIKIKIPSDCWRGKIGFAMPGFMQAYQTFVNT